MSGGHTWRTTVSFCYSFFFFWLHHLACNILAPQSEIKLVSPAVEAQRPNHWTAIKVPLPLLRWKGLRMRREVDLQFCPHLWDSSNGKISVPEDWVSMEAIFSFCWKKFLITVYFLSELYFFSSHWIINRASWLNQILARKEDSSLIFGQMFP